MRIQVNITGSAYTLALRLGISEEEAEKIVTSYFVGFKGLKASYEAKKKEAVKKGYIIIDKQTDSRYFFPYFNEMNEINKKVWEYYPDNYKQMSAEQKAEWKVNNPHREEIKKLWKKYFYYRSKLERKSLNYPVQGLSSCQIKMALILFYRYRWSNNLQDDIFPTNVVHDEIIAEATQGNQELCREKVQEFMEQGGNLFMKHIPMKASAVICDYWDH